MLYKNLSAEEIRAEYDKCQAKFSAFEDMNLKLDLSRGKPSRKQLDVSLNILDVLNSKSVLDSENGSDCRNYGCLDGIPEAKRFMAELIGTNADNVMIGGNSSLELMFDIMSHAMIDGLLGEKPWFEEKNRKFLCPAPGYDRHFAITQHFGFELITVPMNEDGPDMDVIEKLVESDESIKGIWCVPKYQNPTGIVFSDSVVRRFAHLHPKAKDFRIFWDNAYCVHTLYPKEDVSLPDIISECKNAGNENMVYEFSSTSKIAFPGGGISAIASSAANLIDLKQSFKYKTIGPDKINQLRQVRYFKNLAGVKAHMAKQADVLRPKFEAVNDVLENELGNLEIAKWHLPKGGYFISFNTLPGCASDTVTLCKKAGVSFTPAGATYPYGNDPEDCNIRIAPSFADMDEIVKATEIFALAVKIVTLKKYL